MQPKTTTIDKSLQNIIEQLIKFYQKPSFDKAYEALTAKLPTQKKFLIKQELARLFKPFDRSIDMSRDSAYPISEFIWQGKRFYLDEIGRRIFLLEVEKFDNQYTEGVYERVTDGKLYAKFEKQYAYEQKIREFEVDISELGRTTRRLEERLHCAKPVTLHRQNGQALEVITSNISRSGCLLRVKPFAALQRDEVFEIDFSSMTSQFKFNGHPRAGYQVKFLAQTPDKDGCQRVGVQLCEHNYEWTHFLDKYVLANRAQYKVDITNAKDLAETRLLEAHLLNTSGWMSVFARTAQQQLKQLNYVLTNPTSKTLYDYFIDENNLNRLNGILVRLWPHLSENSNAIAVVRFEQQGKIQFLAATLTQLIEQKQLASFVAFANQKGILQLLMLRKREINAKEIEDIKFSWFDDQKKADRALSPLNDINQLISLYPLNQQETALELDKGYKLTNDKVKALTQYLAPTIKNHHIGQFDVQPKDARKENRYFYTTSVQATNLEQNTTAAGKLIDLSLNGLSIKIDNAAQHFQVTQVIAVTVPKFEQFGERNAIHNALYQIVGINPKAQTLHLQVYENENAQNIRNFLQLLIQTNRTLLSINDSYDKFVILQKALRIAFMTFYPAIAFGLTRSVKKPFNVARLLTSNYKTQELISLSDLQSPIQQQHVSVFQLIYDDKRNPPFLRSITRFLKSGEAIADEVAFYLIPGRVDITKQARAGANPRLQNQFIRKAVSHDGLKVFSLNIQPSAKNLINEISEELNYIARYNKHQAEKIQALAKQLCGIIEVVDTDEFWWAIGKIDINKY
ncbi:PilZ domain-containing protein [Catenovulum sp. SX2]|uniref:PilZ domain-containing protein n=1 Tax=Catenovulum sp. SX2 TaxID=3398614 RepID=UPI003F8652C2